MDKLRKLPMLLSAGAAGLLLTAQAVAQNAEQAQDAAAEPEAVQQQSQDQAQNQPSQQEGADNQSADQQRTAGNVEVNAWPQSFQSVDENDNNTAEWDEIESAYQPQSRAADLTQENAENRFDRNGDSKIDEAEYFFFVNGLNADLPEDEKAAYRSPQQEQEKESEQQLSSSDVADKTLVNSSGEELGYVQDLVNGQENTAVVVQMNDRAKSVLLSTEEVEVEDNQVVWQKDQDADALAEMPEYEDQDYVGSN